MYVPAHSDGAGFTTDRAEILFVAFQAFTGASRKHRRVFAQKLAVAISGSALNAEAPEAAAEAAMYATAPFTKASCPRPQRTRTCAMPGRADLPCNSGH